MSEESEITDKFAKLMVRARKLGLKPCDIDSLPAVQELRTKKTSSCVAWWYQKTRKLPTKALLSVWVVFQACLFAVLLFDLPVSKQSVINFWFFWSGYDIEKEPCLVILNDKIVDITRPPVDCRICDGLTEVDRVRKITPEQFEEKYAYTGRPLVVEDGAHNWTATASFSFGFFKNIYSDDSPALQNIEQNCQFFPYKTSFHSLGEVFNMSVDRAEMKDGSEPWYIGW